MSKISSGMKSLFTVAQNMVNNVDQYVTEDIKTKRLDQCLKCPKLIELTKQCGECYCFVNLKTQLKQESCPLNVWTKEPKDD